MALDKVSNAMLASPPFTRAETVALLPGFLFGLTMANNTTDAANDIDVAAGQAVNSAGSAMMVLASGITKRLDAAWAVGTGNGGRMSAAAIADTTYHVHLIRRPDTGVVDVGFDISPTAPTLPANYTQFRRIGSVVRKAGSLLGFSQSGDEFLWKSGPIADIASFVLGSTAVLQTLTVPTGLKVVATVAATAAHGSLTNRVVLFTSPDQADVASGSAGQIVTQVAGVPSPSGLMLIRTNAVGQVRSRGDTTSFALNMSTHGWIDRRGRDS